LTATSWCKIPVLPFSSFHPCREQKSEIRFPTENLLRSNLPILQTYSKATPDNLSEALTSGPSRSPPGLFQLRRSAPFPVLTRTLLAPVSLCNRPPSAGLSVLAPESAPTRDCSPVFASPRTDPEFRSSDPVASEPCGFSPRPDPLSPRLPGP
jgi:hypothetical protein